MAQIEIVEGIYKVYGQDRDMKGYRFELVEQWRDGGYVTVVGSSCQPPVKGVPDRNIRIKCRSTESYIIVSGDMPQAPVSDTVRMAENAVLELSDEEVIERTRQRFQILTDMTRAVRAGDIRAMIVSGPPGVGKSFGVEEVLAKEDLFDALGQRKPRYEIVKGEVSALGLYSKLYEFSDAKSVIVFDDCDSVLLDDDSLNLLKGALDSSRKRTISWNKDSNALRRDGIPNRFDFLGSVIFITNIKFDQVRSNALRSHLAALESRCHYIDLQMGSTREKMLRIRQIVNDGMLAHYEFEPDEVAEILDFVGNNTGGLRELSLRTVLKIADLRKSFSTNWQGMSKVTVMR